MVLPSVVHNDDDFMFLMAWFVDKGLLDTVLQYNAIL